MSSTSRRRSQILASAVIALAVLAGPSLAEQSGRCYTAQIPEPVLLPDGSRLSPGTLRICMNQEFTPGTGLLATYSNGEATGIYIGRVGTSEGSAEIDGPFFLFLRQADGILALQGYAVGEGDRMCTYSMSPDAASWDEFEVKTHWKLLAGNTRSDLVVVAAS